MNSEKLRASIEDYLTTRGNTIKDIDEIEIITLIENLELANKALKILKSKGVVVTIPNGNGIATTKQNPALSAYQTSIKMVRESCIRLAISRADRIKLKIEDDAKQNDIDKLNGLYN